MCEFAYDRLTNPYPGAKQLDRRPGRASLFLVIARMVFWAVTAGAASHMGFRDETKVSFYYKTL